MKILRIIPSVAAAQGGPVEGMREGALVHCAAGHWTEVMSLDPAGSAAVADFPFVVHVLGPGLGRFGWSRNPERWIGANAARFDAAVVHGLWTHGCIAGALALARAGLPYVVYTHGMLDPWFLKGRPINRLAKQVMWLGWQGRALAGARTVLFTAEEERRRAEGVFFGPGYRAKVVPYGASEPGARERAEGPAAFAAACPLPAGARYLLFMGRLHRKKGVDLLLEAFAGLAGMRPDLHLVVAGPDQQGLADELRALAQRLGLAGRLHLPGMVRGAAKWGAYLGAEAFVLPSHQENFGIVLAEAMAVSVPVITTTGVNIWREIEAAGAGLVTDPSVAGLGRALRRWHDMPAEARHAMGRAARLGFERHFNVVSAANALLEVLAEAAGMPRPEQGAARSPASGRHTTRA
jgi:glycosyltransferase involved in cell wall biosynthesis